MKAGALAVGVFLIVIGVAVFWIGYSDLPAIRQFIWSNISISFRGCSK